MRVKVNAAAKIECEIDCPTLLLLPINTTLNTYPHILIDTYIISHARTCKSRVNVKFPSQQESGGEGPKRVIYA